ncbi:MAG: guanylate kinase [Acidimicrobiia bacterium]|nr:guanylate kinase [Acidimicrobiia bacterium]
MVSGPGGVGKGTVVAALVKKHPELWLSRSWTTREQRPGEADDAYVFVSREEFADRIATGGFLEWAEFLGNLYGTPIPTAPEDAHIILEIDVQGARQIVEQIPDPILIFIEAPSPQAQRARLESRGDPREQVAERVAKAAEEADAGAELGATVVVNHTVDGTVDELYRIISEAS